MFAIVYKASNKAKGALLDSNAWAGSSLEIIRALEDVGVSIEILGLNHVAACEYPCVFIANHMSILETFILPAILLPYKDISFIIKRALVRYPVFREIMLATHPIVVDRLNPRDDLTTVLREGAINISSGRSVIVFPQTTRTTVFDPKRFNSLGVKLAQKVGVPVIPIALKTDAWGCGRILKDFGRINPSLKVHLAFGKPLRIQGRGGEEHERIIDFIGYHLKQWNNAGDIS